MRTVYNTKCTFQTKISEQNQPKVDRRKEIIKQEWKSLKLSSRNGKCMLAWKELQN